MNKSYTCTAILLSALSATPCLAVPCNIECNSQQKQAGTLYGDYMASTIAAKHVFYINLASEAESILDIDVFAELKLGRIILVDATTVNIDVSTPYA